VGANPANDRVWQFARSGKSGLEKVGIDDGGNYMYILIELSGIVCQISIASDDSGAEFDDGRGLSREFDEACKVAVGWTPILDPGGIIEIEDEWKMKEVGKKPFDHWWTESHGFTGDEDGVKLAGAKSKEQSLSECRENPDDFSR
jgi:hypothetical protein